MNKNILPALIIIMSSILFLGCFGVDGNFLKIKNDIFSTADIHYYKDNEFGIGPVGMSMAKMIVNLSDDDQDAKEILKHISKVQIGIYKNDDGVSFHNGLQVLEKIDERMKEEGWQYIVKSREKKKLNVIYIKTNSDYHLKELFVISLSHKKLELVQVNGNLDKAIQAVIRNKGMSFKNGFAYSEN